MMVSIICISAGVPARDWQYCDSNLIQILPTTFTQSEHIKPLSPAWPGRGSVLQLELQFTTWWVVDSPGPSHWLSTLLLESQRLVLTVIPPVGLYWAELREKDDNLLGYCDDLPAL